MSDIFYILTVIFTFFFLFTNLFSPLISSLPQPIEMLTWGMEGNKPTGCMGLLKYVQLKYSMKDRLRKMHKNDPLYPMVDVMISKIITYLDESLACDTIVLETIFHPGLRLKFFSHSFPNSSRHHNQAQQSLEMVFTAQKTYLFQPILLMMMKGIYQNFWTSTMRFLLQPNSMSLSDPSKVVNQWFLRIWTIHNACWIGGK